MTNTQKEVKALHKEQNAPARKAMIETVKTVLIIALVVGFITFMGGVHYQQHLDSSKQQAIAQAVKAATPVKH